MSIQPPEPLESSTMEAMAARLFDAIEAADVETLGALYAPGAELWTNVTQRSATAAEVAAFLPAMARKMPDRRYVNRRITPFDGGFVQRHRLTGTRRDGARVAAECCALVFVEDGAVTRIEEYLDSRQLEALLG